METKLDDLKTYKNLKSGEKGLFRMILEILVKTKLLEKFFKFLVELAEKFIKNDEKKRNRLRSTATFNSLAVGLNKKISKK